MRGLLRTCGSCLSVNLYVHGSLLSVAHYPKVLQRYKIVPSQTKKIDKKANYIDKWQFQGQKKPSPL